LSLTFWLDFQYQTTIEKLWNALTDSNGRVNLHLEQTGISNKHGFAGARQGWSNWCDELGKVLAA